MAAIEHATSCRRSGSRHRLKINSGCSRAGSWVVSCRWAAGLQFAGWAVGEFGPRATGLDWFWAKRTRASGPWSGFGLGLQNGRGSHLRAGPTWATAGSWANKDVGQS